MVENIEALQWKRAEAGNRAICGPLVTESVEQNKEDIFVQAYRQNVRSAPLSACTELLIGSLNVPALVDQRPA